MTADNAIVTNDTRMLFTELKNVVDLIYQENSKTKEFQEKMTEFLVGLGKESDAMKQKVENEVLKVVDNKVGAILEKLKREEQDQWQKTLSHVNNNFKDADSK